MATSYRRSSAFAILAAAAIGLAACGGSSSPHVASLGHSNTATGATTTTTLPKGNPTQLLDEWTNCERSHGDPNQVDPTIDANKDIHITFPAVASGNGPATLGGIGPNDPCGAYLTAASTALRGGQAIQKPDPAKLEKYSQCMRANGIPDFPDPTGNGLQIQVSPGSDLNPNNPTFLNASKVCAKKTGVQGPGSRSTPPPGAIEATSGSGPAGGPGGNGGAGTKSGVVSGSG